MPLKPNYQYFKIHPEREDYKGKRFFKQDGNFTTHTVFQVCINEGDVKRGRGNLFGITMINKMTLFGNYIGPGYAIPCTKKEYEKAFAEVLKYLK